MPLNTYEPVELVPVFVVDAEIENKRKYKRLVKRRYDKRKRLERAKQRFVPAPEPVVEYPSLDCPGLDPSLCTTGEDFNDVNAIVGEPVGENYVNVVVNETVPELDDEEVQPLDPCLIMYYV